MRTFKSITSLFLFLLPILSNGQDGSLDILFGENGSKRIIINERSTRGKKLIVLNDNSMLLGVSSEIKINGATFNRGFYIYKLLENGQIDEDFGQSGQLYFPNDNNNASSISSFKLVANNKILVKCYIAGSSKLIRMHPNGILDNSFGNNGIQSIETGGNIDIQSDGKIILQGQFFDGFNNMYTFSRYNPDGSLDLSFGDNGNITHDVTDFRFDLCAAIIIQEDNKIIAVGRSYDIGDDYRACISRFTEDGFLDSSFGNNGTIITSFSSQSEFGEFNDVGLIGNKIVVGGNMYSSGGTGGFSQLNPAIAKFSENGSYDMTFGQQGRIVLETIYNANDYLRTIEVQPNGKVLIGGGASLPFPISQTNFYITRLNFDGSIDTNFGDNGIFLTDFDNAQSRSNYVTDFALHSSEGLLAFGVTKDFNDEFRNAIVCRLNNNNLSTTTFSNENIVKIYPNPTNDRLHIISNESILKIEIYNAIGQLTYSNNHFENLNETNLSLDFLVNGVYEINIYTSDNNLLIKRIIKK